MKLKPLPLRPLVQDNLIANFGTANLVRNPNGGYYLIGGNDADRAAAREWVSMFMPYAATCFSLEPVDLVASARPASSTSK